jgi:hypothetical protein
MIEREQILGLLPPFKGNEVLLIDEQSTHDIISEILNAHDFFSADYDQVSYLFDTGNTVQIARNIFDFLKTNVRYREEPDWYLSKSI